ncbi:hypothetical protein ACK3TF_006244 [Chlorella vulgaris]
MKAGITAEIGAQRRPRGEGEASGRQGGNEGLTITAAGHLALLGVGEILQRQTRCGWVEKGTTCSCHRKGVTGPAAGPRAGQCRRDSGQAAVHEERSGPLRPSGSTAAGPTTRAAAARAAGELALAVLAAPGPPQLTILSHLERNDKMRLGSACSSLRQASLAWFPEVTATLERKTDAVSLAAWLERHQARLHLPNFELPTLKDGASNEYWNDSLTALPPSLVTSLSACVLEQPAAVSALTALTRLELNYADYLGDNLSIRISAYLQPLMRLRQLSVFKSDIGDNAEELLSLRALAGLQALQLTHCWLERIPRALSALTRLTALDLSSNRISAMAPLAALQRLQQLDLSFCSLTAVPEQVSELTALTRLDLADNEQLAGGWLHLLPLTQLQYLEVNSCSLVAVPQQLSALTALTRLDLSGNEQLAAGWHLLLPLTQLQDLGLGLCGLTAVPQQLSALTALTRLDLGCNPLAGGWQHLLALTQLQDLQLSGCGLTAVPQLMSARAALTRLHLFVNNKLAGNWQHLLPLTHLQDLEVESCSLAAVPQQLSALTALTCLDLSFNGQLASGWQHLLALTRLRKLRVSCGSLRGGQGRDRTSSAAAFLGICSAQCAAPCKVSTAAGELLFAVLAAPGPPQLTILGHLKRNDKIRLASACTSLRQASLAWFPEVTVEMKRGKLDVALLAAWLERQQARLHLPNFELPTLKDGASNEYWNDSLTALPPSLVTSLSACVLEQPAAVSALTALTRLELNYADYLGDNLSIRISAYLQPLMRLRQLSVFKSDIGDNAEELLSLRALAGLQALQLTHCWLERIPRALSALTRLTALDLSSNRISAMAPLAALQRLQQLDLSFCSLTAVPEQVSELTALTRLDLADNEQLAGGWLHLLPLTQLQYLEVNSCSLVAVPQQLSALTALTRLDLSGNEQLAAGWHLLLPLTQLQDLGLGLCGLTAVPQQLSALTALTRLDLGCNPLAGGWQHLLALTQLQDLQLSGCGLTAVPQLMSARAALTRLHLFVNNKLAGNWQHLLPLTHLQDLEVESCSLAAVPQQLSALTALTCLDLSFNGQLASGWQHLLALTRLRKLRGRDRTSSAAAFLGICSAQCAAPCKEERSGPLRPSSTTAAGPTTQAAAPPAAGELLFAVLAAPGPPQLTILGHLKRNDKIRLASACTSLRQASLAWFPEVTVEMKRGKLDVALLAAWLERQQAISTLTALTQLDLSYIKLAGGWQHLLQLILLQELDLKNCALATLAGSWQRMLALTQLQGRNLGQCSLMAVPEQLPALTALTRLDLRANAYGCSKEARLCAMKRKHGDVAAGTDGGGAGEGAGGRRGGHSRLDSETLSYYSELDGHLRSLGREESDDRQLLADNALAEAAGREAEVAADAACSRVLEALLPHAATQQLAAFTRGCVEGEGLGELCTQGPFGSHVLEKCLLQLSGRAATAGEEEYAEIEGALTAVTEAAAEAFYELSTSKYGSFVARRLLCVLAGRDVAPPPGKKAQDAAVPSPVPSAAEQEGQQAQHASQQRGGGALAAKLGTQTAAGGTANGTAAADGTAAEYPELLEKLAAAVLGDDWAGEEMARLAVDSFAGPVLQALLRACTHNTKLLQRLLLRVLGAGVGGKGVEGVRQERCHQLLQDRNGSHLMEAVFQSAPDDYFAKLTTLCFKGHLLPMAQHACANFAVQAAISALRKPQQLKRMFEDLRPAFPQLLRSRRSGVIAALLAAAGRLDSQQAEAAAALWAAAGGAEGSGKAGAGSTSPLAALLTLDTSTQLGGGGGGRLSTLGCAMAEAVLRLPPAACKQWAEAVARDPGGCRVLEAYLEGPGAAPKRRSALLQALAGCYGAVAAGGSGNRFVEKCFALADVPEKEVIAGELAAAETRLMATHRGPLLLRRCHVEAYKKAGGGGSGGSAAKAGGGGWQQRVAAADAARREFADLFGPEGAEAEGEEDEEAAAEGPEVPAIAHAAGEQEEQGEGGTGQAAAAKNKKKKVAAATGEVGEAGKKKKKAKTAGSSQQQEEGVAAAAAEKAALILADGGGGKRQKKGKKEKKKDKK